MTNVEAFRSEMPALAGDLDNLIGDYRYGRYCEDGHLSLGLAQAFELGILKDYLAGEDAVSVRAVSPQGKSLGVLLARYSSWDSEHFGYNVAIIDYLLTADVTHKFDVDIILAMLDVFDAWCQQEGVKFVSVRLSSMQLPAIHGLQQRGYEYIESYILNSFDLRGYETDKRHDAQLRLVLPGEVDKMIAHADGAFAIQRFHADPHIDKQKAESLYHKWIESAFQDPRREILVLDVGDEPAAWAVCWPQDLRSQLGFCSVTTQVLLVAPEMRSSGVGLSLMSGLFQYYGAKDVDIIDSGLTMRNIASLNWHNKLGFRIISTQVTFHKWYEFA